MLKGHLDGLLPATLEAGPLHAMADPSLTGASPDPAASTCVAGDLILLTGMLMATAPAGGTPLPGRRATLT